MRGFTDHPDHTRPFLPPAATWHAQTEQQLSPIEQAIWRVLGHNRPLYGTVDPATADLGDTAPYAVLIDHAATSQFDAVVQAARTETHWPDRLVALALTGEGFHGQRNRSWQALRGNLHFTGQYTVDIDARTAAAAITALPAVATVRALTTLAPGARFGIKWVNDILFAGGKVAGVITATQVEGARVQRITLGIGVNVRQAPALPAAAYGVPAHTLADLDIELPALWHALIREIERGLDQLGQGESRDLVATYRQYADFIGRDVVIWPEDSQSTAPMATGRVEALNDDLSLVLDGHPAPIHCGRMTYAALS